MIDTLRNIPIVKTYTDIFKVIVNGYYNLGKVEVGPYLSLVTWNNIEGFRVQGGLKTNYQFSKKWVLQGQLAYGFDDDRVKYLASVQRILSRQRWTTISFRARHDLGRLGVDDESLVDNPIFLAATRWGYFRRGFYSDEYRVAFQREIFKGYSQKISVRHWSFEPTYEFGYFNPGEITSTIYDRFQASEVSVESRYARDEVFLQDDNDRISLGTNKWPVITLKYTHGFNGVLGSDFEYDKLRFNLTKRIKTGPLGVGHVAGPLGVGHVTLSGEYVFNAIPYPLLTLHLGNQSPVYSSVTYNLMNFGEFVSDRYASIQYRQYLEGFLLNRIPLLNKLKWRLLATSNVVVGGMRQSNRNLIAQFTPSGADALQPGYFKNSKPYIELGYGVENIFKIFRVDFIHRVSYLENPDARKFGILFSAQLQL